MQNILNVFAKFGPLRLAAMGAMVLGMVIFFVFISSRLTTGQMQLLYSDLSAQDRNAVVRELEAANISYIVEDATGNVTVNAKEVGRARMMLAEKGLPEGGSVGYEIFDQSAGLGTTRFEQDIKQLRAMEGELMRTVNTIRAVDSSRIHLVLPKRELFSRDSRPATASVFLKLKPGQKLNPEQVQAIQHLIATAVPELDPKHVSIVDQQGNMLANGREIEGQAATAANVEKLRMAYEQRLMFQIEDMLAKVVGAGKVQVVVAADMDYDKETISAEKYDPEGQVARSTQTIEDSENEASASPNNVSVQNNLPGLPNQGEGGQGDTRQSNRTEEITNFEISKTVRNHVREGGQVRNLSVAVLVDGLYTVDAEGARQYTPRNQQELDNIKALVGSAIGFNQQRGDKLEVVNMQFTTNEDIFGGSGTDAVLLGMNKDDLFRLAETGLLGLVSILVVLLVLRPMASKILVPRDEAVATYLTNPDGTMMLDSDGKPMLSGPHVSTLMIEKASGSMPGSLETSLHEGDDELMVDIDAVDGKIKASSIQKVNEIIDRYPNEAVSIVRSWMFQES